MEDRLDIFLVKNGYYESRNRAQEAIKNNRITINGKIINKSSSRVFDSDKIFVQDAKDEWASRGAYKLIDAIDSFNIDLDDKIVLDIGASTGGFTDVCLKHDAIHVFAVDVGHGQLIERLANDIRVTSLEGVNCRYLTPNMFDMHIDFVCMDVSFISIKKIVTNLVNILTPDYEAVFLIKPQFEVGKQNVGKNGIVTDEKAVISMLKKYIDYFNGLHLNIKGLKKCKMKGHDGNQEYLIYLDSKFVYSKSLNIEKIVKTR